MIYDDNYYTERNKARITSKDDWVDILQHEELSSGSMLDILLYMMKCPNYATYGVEIRDGLGLKSIPNGQVVSFGKRVIKLKGIPEQIGTDGARLLWNIPFTTVKELNTNNRLSWKLRPELVEALKELYDN